MWNRSNLKIKIETNKSDFMNIKLNKKFLITGAALGAISVALGALGAHALKAVLDPNSLESFNTGVKYQMYHAILMIILSALTAINKFKFEKAIYYMLFSGVICFSFSIYTLNLAPLIGLNVKFMGPVTPLGGLLLIGSWILLIFSVKK